jgi:hypothetical protein
MISEITSVCAQVKDADRSRVSSASVRVHLALRRIIKPRQGRGNEGDDAATAHRVRPSLGTKELSE